jgi:hypothetical protein
VSRLGLAAGAVGKRLKRKRHPNYRLVKIHYSYSVEEIARLFGGHRNTVRHWLNQGLPAIKDKKPFLILGPDLSAFLQARRTKNKRKCQPGEIYCVRCRMPQRPAGDMADYHPKTTTGGNLVGICPTCDAMIYRAVSLAKLDLVRGNLEVTLPQALQHIDESGAVSVNCDFKRGA